jgi:hypothetical protein
MASQPSDPQGNIMAGFGIGCACQVVFLVLGAVGSMAAGNSKYSLMPLMFWGITQWIALVPLILSQRAKGHSQTVTGMLISGCLGLLLSSTCAVLVLK